MLEILSAASDVIGLIGVAIILVAYFLLSTGRWIADSMLFQFMNMFRKGLLILI